MIVRRSMRTSRTFRISTFLPKTARLNNSARLLLIAAVAVVALCGNAQRSVAAESVQPDCVADSGACGKAVGGLTVNLDITPKPLAVMSELTFAVTVKDGGAPVDDAALTIDLSMPGMFMGKNVVRLALRGDGVYAGTGVIIRCPSGDKIWRATVGIKRGAQKISVPFVFAVRK